MVCPMSTGKLSTVFDVLLDKGEGGLNEASFIQSSLLFPHSKERTHTTNRGVDGSPPGPV